MRIAELTDLEVYTALTEKIQEWIDFEMGLDADELASSGSHNDSALNGIRRYRRSLDFLRADYRSFMGCRNSDSSEVTENTWYPC